MSRSRPSGTDPWTRGRTRSWPPTPWCSRSARAAGWSTCMPWSPPGSMATGTGKSWACRSPAPRTAPAGWPTSAHLTARGLTGVQLVTSDAHRRLVDAVGAAVPGAAWQRCRTHYAANLMAVTPKASWPWVRALLHSVYDQPDAGSGHPQFGRGLVALTDKLSSEERRVG